MDGFHTMMRTNPPTVPADTIRWRGDETQRSSVHSSIDRPGNSSVNGISKRVRGLRIDPVSDRRLGPSEEVRS